MSALGWTPEPWTPGPWGVRSDGDNGFEITSPHADPVACHEVAWTWRENRADAELIALAPEMAEAILRVQTVEDQDAQSRNEKEFLAAWREFHRVHAKIRALKGPE